MTTTKGIAVDEWWAPLEPCTLVRGSKGGGGDDYADRVSCRAAALVAIQRAINHLALTSERLVFNCTQPYAYLPSALTGAGSAKIYSYLVRDWMPDEARHVARILHQARTSDPGSTTAAYAEFLDSTLTATGDKTAAYESSRTSSSLEPAGPLTMELGRGATPANSVIAEGVAVYNNFCPISTVIQGAGPNPSDGGWTFAAMPPRAGADVLADYLEHLRSTFHTLRTTYERNVLMWFAAQDPGGWDAALGLNRAMAANSGNEHGIHITETDYVNVLDFATTTRTATSPGWPANVYRCGRGEVGTTHGQKLKVRCRVLAAADTSDATVRFIGPDSFASNNADIVVTAGNAAWYGDDEDDIYLDTTSTYDDATTARNKIDVHGKAGASGALFIFALLCWGLWS